MAKPAAFTPEQFVAAYQEIKALDPNKTPTVNQLRAKLGGSNTTVLNALREHESRVGSSAVPQIEVPNSLIQNLRLEINKLVYEAQALMQARLADQSASIEGVLVESTSATEALELAQQQIIKLREENAALTSSLTAANAANEAAQARLLAQIAGLEEDLTLLRDKDRANTIDIATLTLKLDGIPDLQLALDKAHERIDAMTKELRDQGAALAKAQALQSAAENAHQLARTDLAQGRTTIDQLRTENKQLASDLMSCRVQAQSQQIALDAAVREQSLQRELLLRDKQPKTPKPVASEKKASTGPKSPGGTGD